MLGEILLGLVPIIFLITGLILLISDLIYFLYGKEIVGKVVATEKYIARSVQRNNSRQLMFRDLIEFHFNGSSYLFFTAGKNYISRSIGSSVLIYSLKNSYEFVRLKKSYHLFLGMIFTVASLAIGYFMVYKSFDHINFLYSCILTIIALPSFHSFLKKKSKGKFSIDMLFKTQFVKREDLEGREIFWSSKELNSEKSKNAKVGLWITFVFIIFYSFIFKVCFDKLRPNEIDILKNFFFEFKDFDLLIDGMKSGPMIGFVFCLVMVPLLFHSVLYSLRRL
ncbi:hypothetical protein [Halobacteriovorax sp.]|uniref:hypothetical protein n=1 Tax=Halobacteriovorax sp. TaxID=2020862 RepID=UPI0035629E94